MKRLVVLMLACLLVPICAAEAPTGTEEAPELADVAGNIEYSPAYTGPQDREHLDFVAGWYSYLPENDTVVFTAKFVSLEAFLSSTREWLIHYQFDSQIQGGPNEFTMEHDLWKDPGEGLRSYNRLRSALDETIIDVKGAGFDAQLGTPGYLRWFVPAQALKQRGESLTAFSAFVVEQYQPAGPLVSTGVNNKNPDIDSEGLYEFSGLTPAGAPDDGSEPALTGPNVSESLSPTGTRSSALGALTAGLILLGLAVIRRRA